MMVDPGVKPIKQQMFELEAQTWLKKGYNNAAGIEQLRELLKEKGRSQANITNLVDEMRRQWARRREWMTDGGSG
ncbi:hypothetical protein [Halopseudomonas sp.]|uniref:hypothetical protein n=1 Tax=Halopseudomonas sp. TaxID=2901191 RepID=UPI0030039E34